MPKLWRSVRRLLANPSLLADEAAVRWDEFLLRRRFPFLASSKGEGATGKTVLMVSLTDRPAYVKMEAMLLKTLQARGCTPVVLLFRSCKRAERYFRAFGITNIIFFDDYRDATGGRNPDDVRAVSDLLDGSPSFHALHTYAMGDVDAGKHALSAVLRKVRVGSLDLGSAGTRAFLREAYEESLLSIRAARALLDASKPDHVLFFEKGYTPAGEIFDCAVERGLDVIQYVNGQRLDTLVFKRFHKENKYVHPFSVSRKSWETIRSQPWLPDHENAFMGILRESYEHGKWYNRNFLQKGKVLKTPEQVRAQLGLDPTKKTVIIFSHVLWDATFFYGTNLFPDYEQWLVATVQAACQNPRVNWIVKLHPDYVWKMKDLGPSAKPHDVLAITANVGNLPANIRVVAPDTDISTYSFFPVADACVTVRGTVGIEAPSFGVRVFTAGTGRYTGMGFTEDSSTPEEYLDKIRRIDDFSRLSADETRLGRLHAHALFLQRPWHMRSFTLTQKPDARPRQSLYQNVCINVRSVDELLNAPDLRSFANWILESKDEDYLATEGGCDCLKYTACNTSALRERE
ncbi:MAG: hypothetical protein PHW10_03115 [Candidatus Peribacteraceae bacterium]|nr:hypothetical protein [Candidatus Peribacteraceae bacterium]